MPDFSFEEQMSAPACGIDEVGRAPVAGPVVAACVFIAPEKRHLKIWREVNDSKLIPRAKREVLALEIREHALFAIGEASVEEIENLNILHASFLAMRRAFLNCFPRASGDLESAEDLRLRGESIKALIDGHIIPKDFPCPARAIVQGDSKSVSIAAASIVAKVHRDGMMKKLSEDHPHYGWHHNAGYPTKKHLDAIDAHGLTSHHRKTFVPVRNYIEFGSVSPQMKMAV